MENVLQIFCTRSLPVSLFFRVHLFKCFHLSGKREPHAFRIALEPVYLTHWDTVTITEASESTISRLVHYARNDEVR